MAVVPTTVSTVGFLAILAALVVVGMAVVMIVTTQVGAQSRELTALRKEAETLSYEQAALTTELQEVSSSGSLALRAAELGMGTPASGSPVMAAMVSGCSPPSTSNSIMP